jgi:hypothetical protein
MTLHEGSFFYVKLGTSHEATQAPSGLSAGQLHLAHSRHSDERESILNSSKGDPSDSSHEPESTLSSSKHPELVEGRFLAACLASEPQRSSFDQAPRPARGAPQDDYALPF